MAKDRTGFIDPSVAALLGAGDRRNDERSMPKAEKARKKKARSRQEERNGRRAVYDLEPDLIALVKKLADEQGTTASMVAGILLHYGVDAIESGDLDLREYRHLLAANPRYEAELVWEEK